MMRIDPRWWQVAVLGSALAYGLTVWELGWLQVAVTLASGLAVQCAGQRWIAKTPLDLKSGLITTLSCSLLLRSNHLWVIGLLTALAVASKFVLRVNGKHLFNPANFALGLGLCLMPGLMWVSPGQWGTVFLLAFFLMSVGTFVASRSARFDISAAFLLTYVGLVFLRSFRLGDPWEVPMHKVGSGAILLFTFFMISDPRTTPDSRLARVLFGVAVAALAYSIHFIYFRYHGPILALFFLTPLVPLLDRLFKAPRLEWADLQLNPMRKA